MATHTKSEQRTVRRNELQELPIGELGKLAPYRDNLAFGVKGDATSENPSKAEMIEMILDHEIGKQHYPL